MKVTLFTSNQARHVSLINRLAGICDELFCIQECNTIFPGQVDDFFRKSAVMQRYFEGVLAAEKSLFGEVDFCAPNVRSLSIKSGDLNRVPRPLIEKALDSDVYIVFGASFIKGWLIEHLVEHNAINIHMGVSPYYRGSSCNFWALYDNNPQYVGATVHKLSRGLDSGPMLYHCIPTHQGENPYQFTMKSVLVAHSSLAERIADGSLFEMPEVTQTREDEVRYTRNADFTDAVVEEFFAKNLDAAAIRERLERVDYPALLNPYFG